MLPIVATVVSMPADNGERTSSEASSSVMSPVSQAAYMVCPKPPALSASRRHLVCDPGHDQFGTSHRVAPDLIIGPECIEHHPTVTQQIASIAVLQANSIGEYLERVGLGQIGHPIDLAAFDCARHACFGLDGEAILHRLYGFR